MLKYNLSKLLRRLLFVIMIITLVAIGSLLLKQFTMIDGDLNQEKIGSIVSVLGSFSSVLLLIVTYLTLRETVNQREAYESPAVVVKLTSGQKNPNLLHFVIKNTGGGAAYNISVYFNPNLPYGDTSLNELNMFKRMPFLEQGEEVSFFYEHAAELYNSSFPTTVNVTVTYYKHPNKSEKQKKFISEYLIDFEERKGQMNLARKDIDDLVNEIEELKYAILLTYYERNDNND